MDQPNLIYDQKAREALRLGSIGSPLGDIPAHVATPYLYARQAIQESPSEGGVFLDLGCGMGLHSFFPIDKGYKVLGWDLSKKSIEVALLKAEKASLLEKVQFEVRSAYDLKEFHNHFDVIFCSGVLYYLELEKIAPMIEDALKPGGRFYCIETNGKNWILSFYRRLRQRFRPYRDQQTLNRLLSYRELKALSKNFEKYQIIGFDFFTLMARFVPQPMKAHYLKIAKKADFFILNTLGLRGLSFKFYFCGQKKSV